MSTWRRGEQIAVAVDLSEETAESKLEGGILLSTQGRGELTTLARGRVSSFYAPDGV
jgi:hypothetical protein